MAKKTKTQVKKSTTKYERVFDDATWQDARCIIQNDTVTTVYKLFNDEAAADAGSAPFSGYHECTHTVDDEPDATALAAVESAISALTTAKARSVLVEALLNNESAEEIADSDSPLYGGTIV